MFILASSSPRRKELLGKIIDKFKIIVPDIDETFFDLPAKDLPLENSKLKAYAIASKYPNDEVLACDTIVLLNGEVLGKPSSVEEAISMLKKESGNKQIVLSGYTYIGKGMEINRTVSSTVIFNELNDELIKEYIEKKKPLDKAGAYGIQDGYPLIKEIIGSYYNVMGLPIEDIKAHIFK